MLAVQAGAEGGLCLGHVAREVVIDLPPLHDDVAAPGCLPGSLDLFVPEGVMRSSCALHYDVPHVQVAQVPKQFGTMPVEIRAYLLHGSSDVVHPLRGECSESGLLSCEVIFRDS